RRLRPETSRRSTLPVAHRSTCCSRRRCRCARNPTRSRPARPVRGTRPPVAPGSWLRAGTRTRSPAPARARGLRWFHAVQRRQPLPLPNEPSLACFPAFCSRFVALPRDFHYRTGLQEHEPCLDVHQLESIHPTHRTPVRVDLRFVMRPPLLDLGPTRHGVGLEVDERSRRDASVRPCEH